jgi:hypothetical protein
VVKVYKSSKDLEAKRAEDQERVLKTFERSLNRASWIPSAQRLRVKVGVSIALRAIERELFRSEAKGIKEGNNEPSHS